MDEGRVGSKFVACMWIYKKEVLTRQTNVVVCAMNELGLCWHFRESRVGVRKHNIQHADHSSVFRVIQWCM